MLCPTKCPHPYRRLPVADKNPLPKKNQMFASFRRESPEMRETPPSAPFQTAPPPGNDDCDSTVGDRSAWLQIV